jgi:transcriptional regulator CtsR
VLRLTEELYADNRATFLFTQTRCLLVNAEVGGPDWLSIAGRYDKNVEDATNIRSSLLQEIAEGKLDIIKITVCAEPENVNGELDQPLVSAREIRILKTVIDDVALFNRIYD